MQKNSGIMLGMGVGLILGLVMGVFIGGFVGVIFGEANLLTDFCSDYQAANYIEDPSAREDGCK